MKMISTNDFWKKLPAEEQTPTIKLLLNIIDQQNATQANQGKRSIKYPLDEARFRCSGGVPILSIIAAYHN